METTKPGLIRSIVGENCPNCRKTKVYRQNGNRFMHIPRMHEQCSACGYKYEREPGYFIGAMYISYALAVLEGIIAFLLSTLFFDSASDLLIICIVAATILLFAFPNFRLSRMVWMHVFPN